MCPASVDPYAPETSAVYQVYDSKGDLLYVGQASSPKSRFVAHSRASDWWPQVVCWTVEWWPTRDAALREEKRLIAERLPRYNIIGNTPERVSHVRRLRRPGGHLGDVHDVMQGEAQVRTMTILGRLAAHKPGVYGEWGAQDLAALLRHAGIRVRKSGGQSVVRLNDVETPPKTGPSPAPLGVFPQVRPGKRPSPEDQ